MIDLVSIISGMALRLKGVIETNLIRLNEHCIYHMHHLHFKSCLEQLYISNKMEHFGYKVGVMYMY